MAKCQAGDCEVECGGGKGCGCISESDNPANCTCICSGGDSRGNFNLEASTLVDVSMSELPLFEAAGFLDALCRESIVVPIDRMSEPVSINLKSTPFGDALERLGITTSESVERGKRRIAVPIFLAGLASGALIFSLVSKLREE